MERSDNAKKYFTKQLLAWHETDNDRSLPWKSERDPYKIWLSEIILQQTRAQQGLPYYLKFIDAFPTVGEMAVANDERVFRLWQGLGYYNRCKNMLATARIIHHELNDKFPNTYNGLLALKGIGPYTAAAIASFAFALPQAVVDGNVYRVLARYFGIDEPIDSTIGKKRFAELAQELLYPSDSSAYNQAIMDLGATVCMPRKPLCANCPLQKKCAAYRQNMIDMLPVKSKKIIVRERYFNYLILKWKSLVWISKRSGRDIWENLHEPYLIETNEPLTINNLLSNKQFKNEGFSYSSISIDGETKQKLTHQLIKSRFFNVELTKKPKNDHMGGKWLEMSELRNTPFPKTVLSFFEKKLYF